MRGERRGKGEVDTLELYLIDKATDRPLVLILLSSVLKQDVHYHMRTISLLLLLFVRIIIRLLACWLFLEAIVIEIVIRSRTEVEVNGMLAGQDTDGWIDGWRRKRELSRI